MSPDMRILVTNHVVTRWHVHCLEAWRGMRELRELLRETELDCEAWVEVAKTAIAALAEETERHRRQRERCRALTRELRALRHRSAA